ncbi:MAG: winged helix DNA-binding domain-containing protein [Methanoregulaceae archaeon]|nr:winged helix DNA-binding domain-containing protein [Methanoregulaceae archaeon]
MTSIDIARSRLYNQQICRSTLHSPEEVVRWMGAVQAQEYAGGLWSIGLRLPGTTVRDIEQAISDRKIVRTWPMRGTLHFVPAKDAKWMLGLLTPRVIIKFEKRRKELGIDQETLDRSRTLFTGELAGGRHLTREGMFQALAKAGISPDGQRGYHIIAYLAHQGLVCFGTREGKQQTFVLLDEWVGESEDPGRDEALAEIARRYFTSHGPATVQDFSWWTGLSAADARAGIAGAGSGLSEETIDGKRYWTGANVDVPPMPDLPGAHLLQPYDEYLVAYKDRSAVFDPAFVAKIDQRRPASPFLIDGQVLGTWRKETRKDGIVVRTRPYRPLTARENEALSAAVHRYGEFLGIPAGLARGP